VSLDSTKSMLAVMPAADGTGLLPAGMGLLPVTGTDGRPEHGSVPTFSNVEDAVRALALVRGYARWRDIEIADVPEFPDVDEERATALVDGWLARSDDTTGLLRAQPDPRDISEPLPVAQQLDPHEVAELLSCFGIGVWEAAPVWSEDEAVAAADRIGYPVVLKTTAPWLTHRAELGSVRLNLESERAVRTAWLSMVAQLDEEAARRLVVQSMASPGVPVVIGAVDDPLFGPIVRFGLGGMASELLGDEAYRIPPLSITEARRLISAPRAAPLLRGYKGTMPVDVNALAELVSRVGHMVDVLPSLASLDLNPVVVTTNGVAVLGARASVRQDWQRVDVGIRRLLDG
jgi:acyl-CoA synthetase (NDP forming)